MLPLLCISADGLDEGERSLSVCVCASVVGNITEQEPHTSPRARAGQMACRSLFVVAPRRLACGAQSDFVSLSLPCGRLNRRNTAGDASLSCRWCVSLFPVCVQLSTCLSSSASGPPPFVFGSSVFSRIEWEESLHCPTAYWRRAANGVVFSKPYERVTPPMCHASTCMEEPPRATDTGGGGSQAKSNGVADDRFGCAGHVNPNWQWFTGGELNVCYNAVDRHANATPERIALYYDSPVTSTKQAITYRALLGHVGDVAAVLQGVLGLVAGDRVLIYMTNSPYAVFAMLACARLGLPHSVVFGGFSSAELRKRIADCGARAVLTASFGVESSARLVHYKALVDDAIDGLTGTVRPRVMVWCRPGLPEIRLRPTDINWDAAISSWRSSNAAPPACVSVPSYHPLYLLYTSGTTGMPKGIVRDTAGTAVMLHSSMSHIYGISEGDVIFTASDIGWIVGHNYIVYGPLLRGCTSVLFEGKPVGTPDAYTIFRVMEEYKVNVFFTAPTAIRAVRTKLGLAGTTAAASIAGRHDLSSLKAVFLAGERSDASTLEWTEAAVNGATTSTDAAHAAVPHRPLLSVPVVDHWWQTETGSPITSAPRLAALAPFNAHTLHIRKGAAGVCCPGWNVVVIHSTLVGSGESAEAATTQFGELVIKLPLPPGALAGVWGKPFAAVEAMYCADHPGYFSTFDAGSVDSDGFVRVLTRTDDVINVAGHRLSTGDLEQALAAHASVAECAVVGADCRLKGQRPLALVVLRDAAGGDGAAPYSPGLVMRELDEWVRKQIGPIASVSCVPVARLPKTRSGKIVRKLIRQIANAAQLPQAERDRVIFAVPPTIEDEAVVGELVAAMSPRHSD